MFKKIVGLWFPSSGKNKKDVKKYISGLVEAGAGEFFTGYTPTYWSDKFGFEVSPNGRFAEHEQITDLGTLREVCETVHSHGLELFGNLNAWYYTDETFPLIEKMLAEFEDIGLDGIICGNIGILEHLKEVGYKWKINISTILAVYNSEAIKFMLDNYQINKVILSRELTLREIEKLMKEFPDTKFEVFWEGDFCRYNNGLCYAEHKYWAKDICTIVVNDLIYKRRYHPDFKEIILDNALSNEQKIEALSDDYEDIFWAVWNILEQAEIGMLSDDVARKDLLEIIYSWRNRVDLFFDAMKPITSERNRNIITLLKWVRYLLGAEGMNPVKREELETLQSELENSVQSGIKFLMKKTKQLGWAPKLRAEELASFYAKGDNLNLYSYLFFSQFPNIDTVKFPTRGRNYADKIALIEKILADGKVDEKYIHRGVSIERAHYDLEYLFWDKLWFRKMINK